MTTQRERTRTIVPLETLEYELYRVRQQALYIAFVGLQHPLEEAVRVLRQAVQEVTAKQCDLLSDSFHEVQRVVQQAITELESPDMTLGVRPYPLLLRLYAFHRTLFECNVLVENARGLCEAGRLGRDLTDVHGHLKQYLGMVIRCRREVLTQLGVQSIQESSSYKEDTTRTMSYA